MVIKPTNKADENAIVVQAKLENMLNPVGYFLGAKVKRPNQKLKLQN